MADARYQTPAVGGLALMIEGELELRIYPHDGGHGLGLMVAENYRPTMELQGPGGGPTGRSRTIRLRKPYTLDKLIEALVELRHLGLPE